MVPKAILLGVAITCATAAHAIDGAPQQDEVIRLSCAGTLISEDRASPPSRIVATGTVDFVRMQVRGFGLAAAPIILASASEVRFGASPLDVAGDAQTIEGAIDRATGQTRIAVRSTQNPGRTLIAMTLDCQMTPEVS